jgi:hypothetical protein
MASHNISLAALLAGTAALLAGCSGMPGTAVTGIPASLGAATSADRQTYPDGAAPGASAVRAKKTPISVTTAN